MRNWSRLLLMGVTSLGPFKKSHSSRRRKFSPIGFVVCDKFCLREMSTGLLARLAAVSGHQRLLFSTTRPAPDYSQGIVRHFSSLSDNAMSNDKDVEKRKMFEEWMAEYGRTYSNPEEKERRFTIFKETVRRVNAHNKVEGRTYDKCVNKFADLTYKEFKDTYCGLASRDKRG